MKIELRRAGRIAPLPPPPSQNRSGFACRLLTPSLNTSARRRPATCNPNNYAPSFGDPARPGRMADINNAPVRPDRRPARQPFFQNTSVLRPPPESHLPPEARREARPLTGASTNARPPFFACYSSAAFAHLWVRAFPWSRTNNIEIAAPFLIVDK